jgi:beta-galactosidase
MRRSIPPRSVWPGKSVNYATTSPLAPRTLRPYIGGAAGSALLNSLGVQFRSATALPASGLVVVGADASISDAQLETIRTWRRQGAVPATRATLRARRGLRLTGENRFRWFASKLLMGPSTWSVPLRLALAHAGSAWVASAGEGWQIGADGLLVPTCGWYGVMLWSQLDPTILPTEEKTYFRFTRWRQTRALSQVLANLGASFAMDEQFFRRVQKRNL